MVKLLKLLYPAAQLGPPCPACLSDIFLSDMGDKIIKWNAARLGPQPTPEFLAKKAVELAPQIAALELAAKRRAAYNAAWSPDEQAEALLEAAAGLPDKLKALLAKRDAVRAALPKPLLKSES